MGVHNPSEEKVAEPWIRDRLLQSKVLKDGWLSFENSYLDIQEITNLRRSAENGLLAGPISVGLDQAQLASSDTGESKTRIACPSRLAKW